MVHLDRGERYGRWIDPDVTGRGALTMRLHQRAGVAGVGFQVQHAVGVGVQHRVGLDLFVAGQAHHTALARRHLEAAFAPQGGIGHKLHNSGFMTCHCVIPAQAGIHGCRLKAGMTGLVLRIGLGLGFVLAGTAGALRLGLLADHQVGVDVGIHMAGGVHLGRVDLEPALRRVAPHKGGAAHIRDLLDGLTRRQAVRDFDNRPLGIAVQQQVAFAVDHDRASHLVRPVVVMRDAAQAALDATEHDGHFGVGLAAALAIDDGGPVGTLATHIAGGVGVVAADFAVGRVAVDHGIHVPAGHTPEQIRFAQGLEGLGALPVRLGDDADPKTLVFQHAADHGHAKAGVVHIGIARDQNDVAAVPAQLGHFLAAHRQKRSRAKAGRPELAVTGQRFGVAREKGDVGKGVHERGWCRPRSVGVWVSAALANGYFTNPVAPCGSGQQKPVHRPAAALPTAPV